MFMTSFNPLFRMEASPETTKPVKSFEELLLWHRNGQDCQFASFTFIFLAFANQQGTICCENRSNELWR